MCGSDGVKISISLKTVSMVLLCDVNHQPSDSQNRLIDQEVRPLHHGNDDAH